MKSHKIIFHWDEGNLFLLSKSRLGSYRPHDPIEGYPESVYHVMLRLSTFFYPPLSPPFSFSLSPSPSQEIVTSLELYCFLWLTGQAKKKVWSILWSVRSNVRLFYGAQSNQNNWLSGFIWLDFSFFFSLCFCTFSVSVWFGSLPFSSLFSCSIFFTNLCPWCSHALSVKCFAPSINPKHMHTNLHYFYPVMSDDIVQHLNQQYGNTLLKPKFIRFKKKKDQPGKGPNRKLSLCANPHLFPPWKPQLSLLNFL